MTLARDLLPTPRVRLVHRLRATGPLCAGATAFISAIALTGWATGNTTLQTVVPGMVSMKVNTALGLILLATATAGIARRGRPWRWLVAACLAAVAALSLATLAEYAFGVDLRLDNAVFVDRASPRFPGRNAPATNVAFLGLACAFALLRRGRAVAFAQVLVFVVAFTPLTTLCGYLYRAPGMYENAPYPAVALNTSIALILLCLAGLFARADLGPMGIATSESLAGSLARTLVPAAIGLPLIAGLFALTGERSGWYSVAFGSALTATSCSFFFAGAVCWAMTVLFRSERERLAAERGRALAATRAAEGEQRLRIAMETARLGSWQFDPATGVVDGTAQYKANFGLGPDEPLDVATQADRVHPDDRAQLRAAVAETIAGRSDYHAEYRCVWPDGSVHWLLASGRAVRDDDGGVGSLRIVGVTLDVTAEKSAGAERDRLLDAERRARAESERAGRMKDEFLATLSHELRTPLSAILGWSQILRREPSRPETLAEGLVTIERNARSQAKIIGDLLDMSGIISGKVSLDAKPIDLAAAVNAAIDTVRPTAIAKQLNVAFPIDDGVRYPIVGDLNRLQQVFWNLLSNAIKFTPRDGTITVRVEQRHALWQVDVTDTGEGIPADFLPFVFDRFRQADASTTRQHGGLGLGLAIVKQLVELHGGKVRVRSAGPGAGSTFTVSLPIRVAHDARILDAATDAPPTPGAAEGGGVVSSWDRSLGDAVRGRSVLILDDDPDARALVRHVLAESGLNVLVAATTDEAIAIVERDRPNVLVSDVGMPGEDGYAFVRRVRALGVARGGDVPAIALTAYARADDRARAIDAGFQAHVSKPVEVGELVAMIASLARRPGS